MRAHAVWLSVFVVAVLSGPAQAACCRVVKTDAETQSTQVRVCAPGPAQSCGAELFTGTLALGQGQEVCVEAGGTIVYQELDPTLGIYRDPVEARCDGGDVEL